MWYREHRLLLMIQLILEAICWKSDANKLFDTSLQGGNRGVMAVCWSIPPHAALARTHTDNVLGVSINANNKQKYVHRHVNGYAKIATHTSTGTSNTHITAPFWFTNHTPALWGMSTHKEIPSSEYLSSSHFDMYSHQTRCGPSNVWAKNWNVKPPQWLRLLERNEAGRFHAVYNHGPRRSERRVRSLLAYDVDICDSCKLTVLR